MDINSIPDIFQSKIRIAIVACLLTGEKTFNEIKEISGTTDGNLSVYLYKLEQKGYLEMRKDFFNNKPRTRYNMTVKGKQDFIEYVKTVDDILREDAARSHIRDTTRETR